MIGALQRALSHPAEVGAVVLWIVGALAVGAAARWRPARAPGVGIVAGAILVVAGIALARLRELAIVGVVRQIPRGQLASHVAREHAAAMGGLWFWLSLAAGLCLLPRIRGPWRPPGGFDLAAVAVLSAMAIATSGGELALAACLLLVAGALRSAGRPAAIVVLAAAAAAAEAAAWRPMALADPAADLAMMERAYTARIGWIVAVVLWGWGAARASRRRWRDDPAPLQPREPSEGRGRSEDRRPGGGWRPLPALSVALAALVAGIGVGTAWQRSRTWGPPSELATLAVADAPVFLDARIERLSGGCVWQRGADGWRATQIGRVSTAHAMTDCIADRRGPRGEDRPVVLVSGTTDLRELVRGGVGELQLLVRLDDDLGPVAITPWRVGVVAVQLLAHDTRWRPLPDPVVIRGGVAHRRDRSGTVVEALQGASLRTDLVALDLDLDVAGFLQLCADARSAHPEGLRCAVAIAPDDPRWGP